MRSTRDGGRSGFEGTRHLVLVRGGLESRPASGEDGDWQSFCARIGWQFPRDGAAAERALPDDFEDRILSRILAEPEKSSDSSYEDSVDASWVGPGWIGSASSGPVSQYRERGGRKRNASTASTALLVAAVVGLAAAALLPLLTKPPSGSSPRPDPAAQQRAPAPDRQPDMTPPPIDSANTDERHAPAKPDATENARAPRTEPPGSPVARRARARGHAGPDARARAGSAARDPVSVAIRTEEQTLAASQVVEPDAVDAVGSGYAIDERASGPLLVAHRSWSDAPSPRPWTNPSEDRVTTAGWSLSPEQSRWYGASLPPPGQSTDVHSGRGIGVMAQVDLSKALVALEASRSVVR
jgi:hypothetical protein